MNTLFYTLSASGPKTLRPKSLIATMESLSALTVVGSSLVLMSIGANEIMTKAQQAGLVKELTDWQYATFTFMGAVLASLMTILLRKQDWRENAARFIGASVMGIAMPRILSMTHPALKEWTSDPIILCLFGFGWGMLGFALAKWLADYAARKAPQIAERHVDDWAHRRDKRRRQAEETEEEEP